MPTGPRACSSPSPPAARSIAASRLGYIEALLRQRFGETQPQAVATVIIAARQPVTLQELQEGLQQVGPQLTGGGPSEAGGARFEPSSPGSSPSAARARPRPSRASGCGAPPGGSRPARWAPALAEVLRLPGRGNAADWIVRARRYVLARRALDTIETAALLEPRAAPSPPAAPAGVRPSRRRVARPRPGRRAGRSSASTTMIAQL